MLSCDVLLTRVVLLLQQSELAPDCMEKKIDDTTFPYWLPEKDRVTPRKYYVSLAGFTTVLVAALPVCWLSKEEMIALEDLCQSCWAHHGPCRCCSAVLAVRDGVGHACAEGRRLCCATETVYAFFRLAGG